MLSVQGLSMQEGFGFGSGSMSDVSDLGRMACALRAKSAGHWVGTSLHQRCDHLRPVMKLPPKQFFRFADVRLSGGLTGYTHPRELLLMQLTPERKSH